MLAIYRNWTLYSVGRLGAWNMKWLPTLHSRTKIGAKRFSRRFSQIIFWDMNWGKSFSNWSFNFHYGTKIRAKYFSSILHKLHYRTRMGANSFSSRLSNIQCGTKIRAKVFSSRILNLHFGTKIRANYFNYQVQNPLVTKYTCWPRFARPTMIVLVSMLKIAFSTQ